MGEVVREIFWTVLGDPAADVILDRAHRCLGPRPADPSRPRDVICRLHRYSQKESILRQAWDHGDEERGGSQVRILPVLSRATLRRRPILELAKKQGFTYRWGYPLSVSFRGDAGEFTLQSPLTCRHFSDSWRQNQYMSPTGFKSSCG